MSAIYDRAAALGRLDGDEPFFQELIDLFLDDFPRQLTAVRAAAAAHDAAGLMRAAHCLKGSIANFASQPAYDAALRLERMGASGQLDCVDQALDALVQVVDRLAWALAQPVAKPSTDNGRTF